MNKFVAFSLLVIVAVSNAASIREKRQVIPREFANINIDNYLKNDRAVKFQLKCVLDEGPCDRIGKYMKQMIPELLSTRCANCDPANKDKTVKLISHIQTKFPEEWQKSVLKFNGGPVKAEDAAKIEEILGLKLDPKLIAAPEEGAAPEPEAKMVEADVPATSEASVSTASADAESS